MAREDRRPFPPEVLATALHDRIHPPSGRLLAARPVTSARKKRTEDAVELLLLNLEDAVYEKTGERIELEDEDRGVFEIDLMFDIE